MNTTAIFLWNRTPEKYAKVDRKKKVICINQGGTACFDGNTDIVTDKGLKKITDISVGDSVLSYNENEKINEYKKVIDVFEYQNIKKTIRVKLKNGLEIICTEDHKFYVGGTWLSIKEVLSLWKQKHNDNETDTKF